MKKQFDLPNIGPQLAKLLLQVGVETTEQLKCSNAESLFVQIRAFDPTACVCKLMAIDGAIKGIRWHDLPNERTSSSSLFRCLRGVDVNYELRIERDLL